MITSGFSILSGFHPKQHYLETQAYFFDPFRTSIYPVKYKNPIQQYYLRKESVNFFYQNVRRTLLHHKKDAPF